MKSVIITGGTIRLGKFISDALRDDGWMVLTTSHRTDSGADIIVDFRREGAADACFEAARRKLGGAAPTALVNNAALYVGDDADIEVIGFEVPRRLTELLAAVSDGTASVVNLLDAAFGCGSYAVTKDRLRKYTQEAAVRLLGRVRVNAVSPGSLLGLAPVDMHEKAASCGFSRPRPEDVASAVRFLLENPAVTGQELLIDGGAALKGAC